AVQAVRAGQAPAAVIVAVPVGSAAACRALADPAAGLADEVVCLCTPEEFEAVGAWYADFHQVDDEEVRAALAPGDPLPDLPRDPL
ncbi:MAG TPA: hypothetical protein VGO92_03005, partial [Acidimicrobiales bacterium]|nr:hypothetical protein [Acidimicrobiales bacterium]